MTEQIMKILPVELPYENIRENEDLELHFALGYNCSIKDCASAIEKANLVVCPSLKEIELVLKDYEVTCNTNTPLAKALLALLRGDK